MKPLEDRVDELREDRVQRTEVNADDQYEEEDDSRELCELLAVGPLNPLLLGPHGLQDLEDPTARVMLCAVVALAAAALAAGPGGCRRLRGPVEELLVVY